MSGKFTVWYMALLAITCLSDEVPASIVHQFPKRLDVPSGTNVTMYCNAPILKDTVNIRWRREGENSLLERDRKKQFIYEKSSATLVLLDVKFADSGMYYCEAEYQEQPFGNGSGSKLTVFAPPTQLEIVPIGDFSSPQQLLCKTTAFYPKELEIVWQKNNKQTRSGREAVINQTAEGLYEAYRILDVNQSAWGTDVYICLVLHVSLTVPACFSYILEQGADTRLILACAMGGSVILILILIIVLLMLKLKRSQGGNKNSLGGCQNEDPAEQAPLEHATAYASLKYRESKLFRKGRHHEEHVVYSQTKGNGADKLTYAALQSPDSNYTQTSKHQTKHTLYADVNTSKKL